jgi:hypothetical protein
MESLPGCSDHEHNMAILQRYADLSLTAKSWLAQVKDGKRKKESMPK